MKRKVLKFWMTRLRSALDLKCRFFSFRLVYFPPHQVTSKQALSCQPKLHARKTKPRSVYITVSYLESRVEKAKAISASTPLANRRKGIWPRRLFQRGLHGSSLAPTASLTPGGAASFVLTGCGRQAGTLKKIWVSLFFMVSLWNQPTPQRLHSS